MAEDKLANQLSGAIRGISLVEPYVFSAAAAGVRVIDLAQRQGWLTKLRDMLKERRPVLVLGASGVGKSNFLLSLRELFPPAIDAMNRTAEAVQERIKIDQEIFMFMDTPGQKLHSALRNDALLDSLGTPKLGIINVVSWGFHENRTGGSEAIVRGKPDETWLSRHRDIEIEYLKEWAPFAAGRPEWVFTVISKADLWWNRRDEVFSYYEDPAGDYVKTLKDAGIRNHAVLGYCSVRHHFYGTPINGGLDDKTRTDLQQQLLNAMLRVVA